MEGQLNLVQNLGLGLAFEPGLVTIEFQGYKHIYLYQDYSLGLNLGFGKHKSGKFNLGFEFVFRIWI